jgi:ribosomal protein S18 acetylase RimI-like enzyme
VTPRTESDGAVDPLAHWPARTRLYDGDGRLLLVYTLAQDARDGRPCADGAWRPESAPVEATVAEILHSLAGFAFSTSDTALVKSLTGVGAAELRHAHVMSHPLVDLPRLTVDSRLRINPLSPAQVARHAERLGELAFAAYPVGHPDHSHQTVTSAVEEIRAIGRGELLGQLLAQSRVALSDGRIVGACLVVDREGSPPEGGPWVIDIFRDPACAVPGVGTALLGSALAAAKSSGVTGLSLAVSHANDTASSLYGRLGFVEAEESWTLAVPS